MPQLRQKMLRQQQSTAERRKKDLSWFVRMCYLCALFRGLQTSKLSLKGFKCCGAKLPLRCADSRFAEPRNSLQRERFSCFSLVRKEPKVHQRFANLWTPGTIQSFAGNIFEEASDNTSRNRLFAQNGGEKALNRCEIQALQHKELERR